MFFCFEFDLAPLLLLPNGGKSSSFSEINQHLKGRTGKGAWITWTLAMNSF